MGAIAAKIAGNSGGSPPSGSVTLGDLAPLSSFSVIGNETASSATPTAVKMMGIPGQASTATAAGTTTLTNLSKGQQIFTGATTQTIVLPVVSTLPILGFGYLIVNNSSGALTVNSSGANLVVTIAGGDSAFVFCKLLTGTSAASWQTIVIPLSTSLALIAQTVTNGDTTHAPSGDAVFDAIAAIPSGITNSAGANVLPVTVDASGNLGPSQITDNGTTVDIPLNAAAGIFQAGPVSNQILISGTDNDGGIFLGNFAGIGDVYINIAPGAHAVGLNAAEITLNASNLIAFISPVINIGALPTSDPTVSGQLWNNLGVVMRSNG